MNEYAIKSTRKLDDLNRITLPQQVKAFGWGTETPLDVYLMTEDESVVLRAKPSCTLCGDTAEELISIADGFICKACRQAAIEASWRGEL